MRDLQEGILREFAERQGLATVAMSYERVGLRYMRRSSLVYFVDRRAELKRIGRCASCPARVTSGTRCVACAYARTAKARKAA